MYPCWSVHWLLSYRGIRDHSKSIAVEHKSNSSEGSHLAEGVSGRAGFKHDIQRRILLVLTFS